MEFFETGFLYIGLAILEHTLWTKLASAFLVLGLKMCATTPGLEQLSFLKEHDELRVGL